MDDAEVIARIYNEGIQDRIATFETRDRSVDDIRAWFSGPYPIVVVEDDGRVIAWANGSTYRPRDCYAGIAEFSVYVTRDARGTGAGRLAMNGLIEQARAIGLDKLVSRVFIENIGSRHLLAQLGFREVGIYPRHGKLDGVWRDVVIVELELRNHDEEPRGALWQPDIDSLPLWEGLTPGTDVIIEKVPWETDREPWRYPGTVVSSDMPAPWIAVDAIWLLPESTYKTFPIEHGSVWREYFSPRHPFNAMAIHNRAGDFLGWYANVTKPSRMRMEGDTPVIIWDDLVLDVATYPDGTLELLDEDELQEAPLPDWLKAQIMTARDRLREMIEADAFPLTSRK